MPVRIERATGEDLPDVLRLVAASQLTVEGLTDHLATLVVARHHAAIVGTAALEMYSEGALLRSLAVAPEVQGRRIGHRLVEACIELARTADVPAIYLLTLTAEQFFPRFGFERIARADVPASVLRSVEFAYACPPSSIAMRRFLRAL